ncbi:sensor domain-containing diguanylate cyclase [Microvirga lenta]|uniref:sensor domain-containing diguanylate cyclase n=1 Tax=Microvirga lenta TaxID=2881337 RepID=UPI001CFF7EE8|nr:diguanylate cyclase [Microvirga lenta]MCB5177149.1 diguanylate cyclase [Microvirga lenta]
MKRMEHLSLRRQITILVGVLCLVLVCSAAAGAALIAHMRTKQLVMADAADTAATMAAMLDRDMFERFREAQNVAQMQPLQDIWTGDPARIRQVLNQLQSSFPDYAWIGYATPDGTVRAATRGMLEGQSVQARPWFQDGLKAPAVGDVHEAKLLAGLLGPGPNNEPFRFVDVAAPVRDRDGTVIGVLGAHLSWSWADARRRALLAQPGRTGNDALWVLAEDGTVLLGPEIGDKPFSAERIQAMRRERTGAFEDETGPEPILTGFAVASGHRSYPGLGWIVVSRQPDDVAFAAARSIAWTILGLGLALALAGLVFAHFIARGVARPLQIITAAADRIGRDPDTLVLPRIGGSAEVIRLSAALRSLLRRVGSAEKRISEVSSRHEKDLTDLRHLAETDALSGLLNRRGFDLLAEDAFDQFTRSGRGFAVLLVDIDLFKSVNDTYGHVAGDEVIKVIGATLTAALRPTDKVARFGGEEFVILVRDIGRGGIMTVAQKIRRAVEAASIRHHEHAISVTVSVGGAISQDGDRDVQDVIERADTALYSAKAAGRNRAVIAGLQLQLATSAA